MEYKKLHDKREQLLKVETKLRKLGYHTLADEVYEEQKKITAEIDKILLAPIGESYAD